MILQSLVGYYEALAQKGEITRPGWCDAKVSFELELNESGELCRVVPLKISEMRGKKEVMVPQLLQVPEMVSRSSGVAANFLCDNSSYLLGMDSKGKPQRSLECFACAKARHREILQGAESPMTAAVLRYFEIWQPEMAKENQVLCECLEEILAGANLVFGMNGVYAQEDAAIRRAWEDYYGNTEAGTRGVCLVTGRETEIARIHGTIKGVQGAQSSGAALVSFNAPAFESYGKEQSFNAPVGTYAAYAYTTALNKLIADKKHMTRIGDTTVVYWSEDGSEAYQDIFSGSMEPTLENYEVIDGVFKNLNKGRAVNIAGVAGQISMDQRFFVLGLAPNAARLAVRFFYQDNFGSILRHIKEHYDRMEIVKPKTDRFEYLGIWRMLQETVNKKSKDKKPVDNMAGAVFRAVLEGGCYPYSLYQAVMGRIRSENDNSDSGIYKITRGRAAIIKAFLLRNGKGDKEEITMALNEESGNIAYTLGRMFSVLEAIQEDANPGINATIKDKYFNSACAKPASTFPVLLKLKNSHIRKLSNKGQVINYEKLLGSLQDKINAPDEEEVTYPKSLTLEDQGMFILGYYHQTQKRFEKKTKEEA